MGRSNMNIKIDRGQQLFIEWIFNGPNFESVITNVEEELVFSFNNKDIKTVSRTIWDYENMTGLLSKELVLIRNDNDFSLIFNTFDTSFLSKGINDYRILVSGLGDSGQLIKVFEDYGTIEISE